MHVAPLRARETPQATPRPFSSNPVPKQPRKNTEKPVKHRKNPENHPKTTKQKQTCHFTREKKKPETPHKRPPL